MPWPPVSSIRGRVSSTAIERWRADLGQAENFADLEARASRLLSNHLRIAITIKVSRAEVSTAQVSTVGVNAAGIGEGGISEGGTSDTGTPIPDIIPRIEVVRHDRQWRPVLIGWHDAPPGPRHVAHLFASILVETAQRLVHALALADEARNQQKQERLAELGALAATVAHDIRNPLNIIAMAAATAPPDMRREIAEQTTRISQLTSDLLDYAKPWHIKGVSLNLADQIRLITPHYPEITLEPGLGQEVWIVGDARRLGQIFSNLFENARAASPDRSARIAVDATVEPDGTVEIDVCDQGIGIDPAIRTTVFQPFVSRSPHGTGLGLAIVAKIMAAHGGTVAITERPGWSTCFTLRFPAPPPLLVAPTPGSVP